jgi:hypothetical protein
MKTFFGRELYIRLAQGEDAFVCTTRYGKFYTKAKKFLLRELKPVEDDGMRTPVRKKSRTAPLSLLQSEGEDDDRQ